MTLNFVHFETSDELANLTNSLGIKQGEIEAIVSDSSGQWTLFYWSP